MSTTFNHYLVELTAISSERLRDTDALSALVVAAAGAVGMPGLGPPVARQGAGEIAVALGSTEGAVKLRAFRAYEELRNDLSATLRPDHKA